MANVIKIKFNVVISSDAFTSSAKQAHDQVQHSFNQEVYLLPEENIVQEIQKLHRSFTSLARDIHCKLDELVKSGKSSLPHITTYVQEAQVGGMKELTKVNTIDDLFSAIRPHNDYLDCELLEMIVEKYLDDDDITKVKAHIDKVKIFKCTTPIRALKNKLQQYTNIPNISDKHLIVTIKLQADWGRVTLESIEKLVQNLLQYQHKVRILKVESGSISVMLLLPKEELQHFIVSSSQKLQFMHLTGIFRLQIGAITVFEERENKNFSFESAFLESSQCGDDEAVRFLLDLGVNVNYSNSERKTALILASKAGQEDVVQTLISAGANINQKDNNGHTALILSKTNKMFLLLLQPLYADINIIIHEESTLLMIASDLGHLAVVETLLVEYNNDPNIQNIVGWSAIMFASHSGHLQVVELLLNQNADPNAHDNEGCTALMFACQNGHVHIVELLLKENVDPNVCSITGWTALLLASKNGHSNVVVMLLQYKANPHVEIRNHLDSFTIATVKGNTDVVNTFLNHSEIRFESLSMGLYYVCQLGHIPIISLLSHRIDIISDKTDLIISCAEGDLGTVIDQLMSGKIMPDIQFIHGITPLMISSSCGHTDIVEALIQSGANVNKTDEFGYTALDYAEQAKQDTTRVLLLQHGGLCGIELDIRVRTPAEPLLKTVDNSSSEKDNSSLNISSNKRYLEESIDTHF